MLGAIILAAEFLAIAEPALARAVSSCVGGAGHMAK